MILLAGLGGFVGAALRYGIGLLALRTGAAPALATLSVNVLGCLAIGVLGGVAEVRGAFSAEWRAFLLAGLLGGFTTYSAFGSETLQLLRAGERGLAVGNVALHLVLGLGAVVLGHLMGRTTTLG